MTPIYVGIDCITILYLSKFQENFCLAEGPGVLSCYNVIILLKVYLCARLYVIYLVSTREVFEKLSLFKYFRPLPKAISNVLFFYLCSTAKVMPQKYYLLPALYITKPKQSETAKWKFVILNKSYS